jgi:hypothetical protein
MSQKNCLRFRAYRSNRLRFCEYMYIQSGQ